MSETTLTKALSNVCTVAWLRTKSFPHRQSRTPWHSPRRRWPEEGSSWMALGSQGRAYSGFHAMLAAAMLFHAALRAFSGWGLFSKLTLAQEGPQPQGLTSTSNSARDWGMQGLPKQGNSIFLVNCQDTCKISAWLQNRLTQSSNAAIPKDSKTL